MSANGNGKKKNGNGKGAPATHTKKRPIPRRFGPVKQAAYLENLRSGQGRMMAARNIGIDPSTVDRHAKAYPDYAVQMELAEIASVEKVENALYMAAESGNVTACIFLLCNVSRRATMPAYKDKWVSVNRQEVTGKGGGPIAYRDLSAIPDEELRKIAGEEEGESES